MFTLSQMLHSRVRAENKCSSNVVVTPHRSRPINPRLWYQTAQGQTSAMGKRSRQENTQGRLITVSVWSESLMQWNINFYFCLGLTIKGLCTMNLKTLLYKAENLLSSLLKTRHNIPVLSGKNVCWVFTCQIFNGVLVNTCLCFNLQTQCINTVPSEVLWNIQLILLGLGKILGLVVY